MGLENRRSGNASEGSNPSLSANFPVNADVSDVRTTRCSCTVPTHANGAQVGTLLPLKWFIGRRGIPINDVAPWCQFGRVAIQMLRPAAPCIYFIGSDEGPVKIGYAVGPLERLASMQLGSPLILTIKALVFGGVELERAYHKRFAAHRLHGEWFHPAPEILAEIERLNSEQSS